MRVYLQVQGAAGKSKEPPVVFSEILVARLWSRRALWFTRMPSITIARLHKADLFVRSGMDEKPLFVHTHRTGHVIY